MSKLGHPIALLNGAYMRLPNRATKDQVKDAKCLINQAISILEEHRRALTAVQEEDFRPSISIVDYVSAFEFYDGPGGGYIPSEKEKAVITNAIIGYVERAELQLGFKKLHERLIFAIEDRNAWKVDVTSLRSQLGAMEDRYDQLADKLTRCRIQIENQSRLTVDLNRLHSDIISAIIANSASRVMNGELRKMKAAVANILQSELAPLLAEKEV